MKHSRRNPPRNKTDVNSTNADPQETQNHEPQDTQNVNIMQMAILQAINNMNNTMNKLRSDLKQSFINTANMITSS